METNFSRNLKYLRNESGIEQKELAETLGYKSSSAVSEWEKGLREPNIQIISKIAEIFRTTITDLMEKDLSKEDNEQINKAIPLLGTIAAGQPILAIENIEDYYLLDPKIKADFCLRIKGDSMINVNIIDGDIVFIKKQSCIDNGEIGAILIDDRATLKRFYYTDGKAILQAENTQYAPIIVDKGDVRVLGKLVATLRDYR